MAHIHMSVVGTVVECLELSPHSEKVLGLLVVPVSVWVLSGYSSFLSQFKNRQTGG